MLEGATQYQILINGKTEATVDTNQYIIKGEEIAEYSVLATDKEGIQSFCSEPILKINPSSEIIMEAEEFLTKSGKPYSNYSGNGFTEISTLKNREIILPVKMDETGEYKIDARYSNGTGPWNTDNNCAIRSLYVNQNYIGILIFPQRGTDEWPDWGFSNTHTIKLNKGYNEIKLRFDEWNTNMDGEINEAMLDYFRLIKTN